MSFRFRVSKVWQHPQRSVCHVVGLLEQGVVVPPVTAKVLEHPGMTVQIDSQAIGGMLPGGQLTFVISESTVEPYTLEGCVLCDDRTFEFRGHHI
jgi:hypothetical protein